MVMKIQQPSLVLFFFLLCNALTAQTDLPFFAQKTNALTVAPLQALTRKGELQLGYEKQNSRSSALELNFGFRFRGTDDPNLAPYDREQFLGTNYHEAHRGVLFILFIPIPVSEGRNKDWTEKISHTDHFATHHVFVTAAYKHYVLPFHHSKVPGGIYLAPSLALGNRGMASYTYSEGQRGKVTQIKSEFLPNGEIHPATVIFGTGFIGSRKLVQEDVFEFSKLEKKTSSKTYLHPGVRTGVQLPVAGMFALDLGGQMTLEQAPVGRLKKSPFQFEPGLRISAWF